MVLTIPGYVSFFFFFLHPYQAQKKTGLPPNSRFNVALLALPSCVNQ